MLIREFLSMCQMLKSVFCFFLILIFLFAVFINVNFGSELLLGNTSQYELLAFAEKKLFAPGDLVNIEVFIYGNGVIDNHRFFGHVPKRIIEDSITIRSLKIVSSDSIPYTPGCPPQINKEEYYFMMSFAEGTFTSRPEKESRMLNSEMLWRCDGELKAPISISFILKNNAPPGDHDVEFTFIYNFGNNVKISKTKVAIKILSFGERYQSALSAILAILIATFSYIYKIDIDQIRGRNRFLRLLPERLRLNIIAPILILILIIIDVTLLF